MAPGFTVVRETSRAPQGGSRGFSVSRWPPLGSQDIIKLHGQPAPWSRTLAAKSHLLNGWEACLPPSCQALRLCPLLQMSPRCLGWFICFILSCHPFMPEGVPSVAGKATESFHFKLRTERHFSRAAKCPLLATEMFERRLSALQSGSSRGIIFEVGRSKEAVASGSPRTWRQCLPSSPFLAFASLKEPAGGT